jgi:hypothetical protein
MLIKSNSGLFYLRGTLTNSPLILVSVLLLSAAVKLPDNKVSVFSVIFTTPDLAV